MSEYVTLRGAGTCSYEDRKSVFIGDAMPVSNEKEALDFLQAVKKRYPDANHHVYAYVLRENGTSRFSDDREPQGTAGLPVLDVLRKSGVVDAVIVVTRYFGGTLLGTGGLVHAYTEAARLAMEAAKVVTYALRVRVAFTVNYSDYQKLLPFLPAKDFLVEKTDFDSEVTVLGSIKKEKYPAFSRDFTEFLCGKAQLIEKEDFFSS